MTTRRYVRLSPNRDSNAIFVKAGDNYDLGGAFTGAVRW
jgi:hypothetical protein